MRRALLLAGGGALLLAGAALAAAAPGGDPHRGEALFNGQCGVCHAGQGGVGPNLHGVAGRRAASLPGFGYSDALKATGWRWDDAHLDRYLTDPQAAVPGTLMPAKVGDAGQRRDLIAYLHTLTGAPAPAAHPGAPPPRGATAKREGEVVVFGDWTLDRPGRRHRITPADLPAPFATASAQNGPSHGARSAGRLPQVPAGAVATAFATDLKGPRRLAVAPNGDVFVAESSAGRISVLRAADGAATSAPAVRFAGGLDAPFGIALFPAADPRWVYVAELNRVVRFPYRSGDLRARAAPEVVVPRISPEDGGHHTRDLAFSPDGRRMYVSVGSASNVAEEMPDRPLAEAQALDRRAGVPGVTWGPEENRADVLVFTPEGREERLFATGVRNCVGIAVQPGRGTVWCSTNERDGLGDNLVPDYITSVREGGYYGWPWWFMGDHEDPRLKGARPDLRGKAIVPDVLLQPHSASLQMTFYTGDMFPEWRGSILAAEHGSWNRALRTGYKLIRVPVRPDGRAEGGYEDVMTGFVADADHVWGRPVGVAVAHDGAVLVSDDASNTVWRLAKAPR